MKKHLQILSHLRSNARMSLTDMSKKTNIPISTIYDKLKQYQGNFIKQHTTLINFSLLGFNTRANVILKVNKEQRETIKDFLSKHQNINSVMKINNGYDFMFEGIFQNIKDMEDFMDILDNKFDILHKNVYYIIDDIVREKFISDPSLLDITIQNGNP